MLRRSLRVVQPHLELTQHCMEQMIGLQLCAVADDSDSLHAGLRSVEFRHHNGAVEGDDGRVVGFNQTVVKGQDFQPIRGLIIPRDAMAGGDSGLEMITREPVPGSRADEMKHSPRTRRSPPEAL